MIELISEIFQAAGFEDRGGVDFKVYAVKDRVNYWVVIQCDNIGKIIDEQIDIFIKASEIVQAPTFDKNANLLILCRYQSIADIIPGSLLQVEEDPYNFKKTILYYTEGELNNLRNKIGDLPVLDTIETLILTEAVFEKHKNEFDSNDFESLVYRMAIKIPFIRMKIGQINSLESLESINKQALDDNPLNDLLEKDLLSISDSEFLAMTEADILNKLRTTNTDENR
ncbi:ABC-three component system middle component 1 [Chitinophaga sp. Cy-1792]|uniref:ABC-three component system middle component 1 n=1 Tax=Chitinophaga sp. Cy-1792 TaxID=2608339 RepID=UPI00141E7C88|nr:ABC-three component system middle component 1 [Chitinophaga sp. Cy-1792]NIG54867.1 hypothetical protein [Chitinophaga sp. Cy-1792]